MLIFLLFSIFVFSKSFGHDSGQGIRPNVYFDESRIRQISREVAEDVTIRVVRNNVNDHHIKQISREVAEEVAGRVARNTVHNELFWKDFFDKLGSKSESLKDDVKRHVMNKVSDEVRRNVETQLESFVKLQIPSHVAKNLNDQLPAVLNRDEQMKQILANHAKNLSHELYATAQNVLNQIVQEERYHKMYDGVKTSADQKVNMLIQEKDNEIASKMQEHSRIFKSFLGESSRTVDNQVKTISEANRRIDNQNVQISKLQDSVTSLSWTVGILIAMFVICFCKVTLF